MQSQLPILIIGQGIAGTLLSFELWQQGIPFVVMDERDPACASFKSAAVLNPYSGRTIKGISRRQAQYETAYKKYSDLGKLLGKEVLSPKSFLLWEENVLNEQLPEHLKGIFTKNYNVQKIEGIAKVNNTLLLESWREWLIAQGLLLAETFKHESLELENQYVIYQGIKYQKIIFCNGVQAMEMDIFKNLRFTKNRGDILLLRIPALDSNYIYQREKVRLVPLDNQLFWCGSNYIWEYEAMRPNLEWRTTTEEILNSWLQIPFTIEQHIVAKRPTTAGQIPLAGWHPDIAQIGICNGFGTKGFSAGPAWIEDFVHNSILAQKKSMFQFDLDKQFRNI
jgi:hypothetical protein